MASQVQANQETSLTARISEGTLPEVSNGPQRNKTTEEGEESKTADTLIPGEQAKNEECYSNDKLPMKILTNIMKFLSAADLKNVSLVCRSWYQASNQECIKRDKKLFINNVHGYRTEDIIEVLMSFQWSHQNLEFQGMRFCQSPREFWQKFGPKLRSLVFESCVISYRTLTDVFSYCDNLQHLRLEENKGAVLLHLLGDFRRNNITFSYLESLELFLIAGLSIKRNLVSKLCEIFPNIRRIKISTSSSSQLPELECPVLPKGEVFPECVFLFACDIDPSTGYWKLKEVGVRLNCTEHEQMAKNFLANFQDIETLKLLNDEIIPLHRSQNIRYPDQETFCVSVLDHNPNLRDLELPFLQLKMKTFRTLLNCSSLENLTIYGNTFVCHKGFRYDGFSVNTTLKRLSLKSSMYSSDPAPKYFIAQQLFLRNFCNLQKLKLVGRINNEILQTIWEYQTSLKVLFISSSIPYSENGFTGYLNTSSDTNDVSYSICRLQKLENLRITGDKIPVAVIDELRCPNLRSLIVKALMPCKFDELSTALRNLARRSPLLECVFISCDRNGTKCWSNESFLNFLEFLSCLKNLQRLWLEHCYPREFDLESCKNFEKIFACRPNLRMFSCHQGDNVAKFAFDVRKKEMIREDECAYTEKGDDQR